jgi:hypothetical protein
MEQRDNHTAQQPTSRLAPIDLFCDRVRADPSLQQALREPDGNEQFIALVQAKARDCGLTLGTDEIRAAMRGRLQAMLAVIDPGDRETELPPAGWLPSGTFWRGGNLYVQWFHEGDARLTEPFFESTVQRGMVKPFNRLIRYVTPIGRLGEWLRRHQPLRPGGFIFHMSRCGSTLVSQMLAALRPNLVVSEAPGIDAAVRAKLVRPDLDDETHLQWLQWMVGAHGQPRAGERNYFIKLDCWHTMHLPLFARAFPGLPWVFLYRDPVEVMVSQLRSPGMHMVPGMLGFNLLASGLDQNGYNREEYSARMLGEICAPLVRQYTEYKPLLINYRQLPEAVWTQIMPHFGVACSGGERDTMIAAARYDAKAPYVQFTPDAEDKQREASVSVRTLADRELGQIHRQLEALRTAS